MNSYKKKKILSFNINIISTQELINQVKNFLILKKGHYISISNVHQCIEAHDSKDFAEVINNADLAIPDGRPIYWALKLLGYKEAEHLPGYYVTRNLCKFAADNNLKIGFYGGEKESLDKCVLNLRNEYQGLEVDYVYSPPFRSLNNEEKKKIIKDIKDSKIEILFVCLGCPKQEYWMAEHKDYLKCISIGIGEAVNLISNKTKLAPKWVERIGMRWITRLISDPKRLFWRYFYTNFKFLYYFTKQYFKFKFNKKVNK
jgi:N-acetylglucosaminyldiphosphoundecaprenol N-acetyl-beta-D-mannosaminyltransferase